MTASGQRSCPPLHLPVHESRVESDAGSLAGNTSPWPDVLFLTSRPFQSCAPSSRNSRSQLASARRGASRPPADRNVMIMGWSLALRPWRGTGCAGAYWLGGGPAALTNGRERAPVNSGPPGWQGRSLTLCTCHRQTAPGTSQALVINQLPVWRGSAERRERRAPPTRVTVCARPAGTSLAVRS